MRRIFTLALGALAMVAVALISAFIAMRLAIHGREAVVPALTGLSVSDAADVAARNGLNLTLENRFYSAGVPAGRILAQDPVPGSRVRREWPVRITESLGSQAVSIPDLTGESERAATVSIRRLSLDLGAVAHFAAPGDPGVVLTQTPPANAGGVDGPRVSLLISDPEASAPPPAYVMPSLLGLTWSEASARAGAAGLHLTVDALPVPPQSMVAPTPTPAATLPSAPMPPSQPPALASIQPPAPVHPASIITSQIPQPGRRVAQGDAIHVTLGEPAVAIAVPSK